MIVSASLDTARGSALEALVEAASGILAADSLEGTLGGIAHHLRQLLHFTDLTVGEIAFRAGFEDQLYFSRAFKRHRGEAPMAYRARLRGLAPGAGVPAAAR